MTQESLRLSFDDDPGGSACVHLADLLRSQGRLMEALEVCLSGLNANPQNYHARLLLARIFSEKGLLEFAIREVRELQRAFPESGALVKLDKALSPCASSAAAEAATESAGTPLAEAELSFDDLERLGAEKK